MLPFDRFIKKAREKHGDKFSYENFEYIDAKTKSKITCLLHGDFFQSPDKHLQSTWACPTCLKENKRKRYCRGIENLKNREPESEFLDRATAKFGSLFTYDLTNYTGITGNEIGVICQKHGTTYSVPHNFLITMHGCKFCARENSSRIRTESYDDAIFIANKAHGGRYIYPETNKDIYKDKKTKITIICPEHGEFTKAMNKHTSGQGCYLCRIDKLVDDGILLGGYNKRFFNKYPDKANVSAILYYLKVGDFYKIGITTNLKNRLKSIKSESKEVVDIIKTIEYNLYTAFEIEQQILSENSDVRTSSSWSTELFHTDIFDNINIFFEKEK